MLAYKNILSSFFYFIRKLFSFLYRKKLLTPVNTDNAHNAPFPFPLYRVPVCRCA